MKEERNEIISDWDLYGSYATRALSAHERMKLQRDMVKSIRERPISIMLPPAPIELGPSATGIPTPAELRARYFVEDQPKLITLDWEACLAERKRFGLDRSPAISYEYGLYQLQKTLRNHSTRERKERRRALEMKISEDYWGAYDRIVSASRGRDFGFIFKQ